MTCDDVRAKLTAYLDGELAGDRGSAIRGHLRGCMACQAVARDEAALRDGLRSLPPLDPDASLWAGVQARLAEAEVADAKRPAWRRALARWAPLAPRFGLAAGAVALAAGLLVWHASQRQEPTAPIAHREDVPQPIFAPAHQDEAPAPKASDDDVSTELASEPARESQTLADTVEALLHEAQEARAQWTDDRKQMFDTHLVELRHAVEVAGDGRPKHTAYRTLIRYLQRAAVRDEVVLASAGGAR